MWKRSAEHLIEEVARTLPSLEIFSDGRESPWLSSMVPVLPLKAGGDESQFAAKMKYPPLLGQPK